MNIGIRSDDVRSKAEAFRSNGKDKFHDMKSYLDAVINSEMPELWQGSGSDAYIARYQQLAPSFQAIETLIEDVANGLIANANFYDEADAAAASANSKQ
ncbi:WXG100 family type VII secretion target [Lacrimispora sp.]|uniref:WXG100 family type VII secretion target n=1 Tax=Lacrimispora sp. TaxID=2719234 RepID=UPI0028B17D44|nr:WXG100 family type VII secretion target [Lacrimispora sp.]